MSVTIAFVSIILIVVVLHDAFETMLLPRRISRQFRFARFFFRCRGSSGRLWRSPFGRASGEIRV